MDHSDEHNDAISTVARPAVDTRRCQLQRSFRAAQDAHAARSVAGIAGMKAWLFVRRHVSRRFTAATATAAPARATAPPPPSSPVPLSKLVKRDDFTSLKIHPSVVSALEAASVSKPTFIQRLAAGPLLARRHTLVAAETGAGKTFAYLAPLLSHLKHSEKSSQSSSPSDSMHVLQPTMRPFVLILVPTRELAAQVFRVTKTLSHVAKFRARAAMGGPSRSALRRSLKQSPVDVLVGTPGAIASLRAEQLLFLSRVSAVVIDEADVLLATEGGFSEQVQPLISSLVRQENRVKGGVQFVYAAATVPKPLQIALQARHDRPGGPKLAIARGDRLHKATPAAYLSTTFIRVAGGEESKFAKAVELTRNALSRKGGADRILIFCNDRLRRDSLCDLLREQTQQKVVHLCGANDREDRHRDWENFLSESSDNEERTRVAVCAKSFGRGIDHQGIGTVLLVDVPWTGAEYLHRVGRVRGSGKAFVLVGKREQAVAEALFLGHVNGENLAAIQPSSAWKGYTTAGRDRIATERAVKLARRVSQARWEDERPHAIGTFRGVGGRGSFRTGLEYDRGSPQGRRRFSRPDRSDKGGTLSNKRNWNSSSKGTFTGNRRGRRNVEQ